MQASPPGVSANAYPTRQGPISAAPFNLPEQYHTAHVPPPNAHYRPQMLHVNYQPVQNPSAVFAASSPQHQGPPLYHSASYVYSPQSAKEMTEDQLPPAFRASNKMDYRPLPPKEGDAWQYNQPPASVLQANIPLDHSLVRPPPDPRQYARQFQQVDQQQFVQADRRQRPVDQSRPPQLETPYHMRPQDGHPPLPPSDKARQQFDEQQIRQQLQQQQQQLQQQQMQQQQLQQQQVRQGLDQYQVRQEYPPSMRPPQADLQQRQNLAANQQRQAEQQPQAFQQLDQQQLRLIMQQQQQRVQEDQMRMQQRAQQEQQFRIQASQNAQHMTSPQMQFMPKQPEPQKQQIFSHPSAHPPPHNLIPPLVLQQGAIGQSNVAQPPQRECQFEQQLVMRQPQQQQQSSQHAAGLGKDDDSSLQSQSTDAVCRSFAVAPRDQLISAPVGSGPNLRLEANEHLVSKAFTPIAVGDCLPPAHIDLHGVCVNLRDFFDDRSGIIFGLVGAFYPVETKKVVPGILEAMDSFERLVDFVGCLVVNDPFVVKAWAKKLGISDQFTFVADSDAKFTKALGMAVDLPEEGLGLRSRRFAAVVGPRARIRWIGFEDEALAPNVLLQLPKYVRTPWKSFLVGVGYQKRSKKAAETNEEKPAADALHAMRDALSAQGFCAESDWQLVLSDQLPDVYKPTRENILSGLKWLVEGSQAGDVLCFYFTGKGGTHRDENGDNVFAILPMDHATNGVITEQQLYELLAPLVPTSCRLTFIADLTTEERVTCPMPYLFDQPKAPSVISDPHWFASGEKLPGEILTVTLEGPGTTKPGCLAKLLAPPQPVTVAEGSSSLPVISYAEKVEKMNKELRQMGLPRKRVILGSSVPLDVTTEFSLADVLTAAAAK